MIDSINLKNYKAFDDVTIPLKPLTILLGANNAGKSSINQMLMLLHQTAEERGAMYSSALKIYGDYVNIGENRNLFKDRKTDNPLQIGIDLNSPKFLRNLQNMKDRYLQTIKMICRLSNVDEVAKMKVTKKSFPSYVNKIFTHIHKQGDSGQALLDFLKNMTGIHEDELEETSYQSLTNAFVFLSKLKENIKTDVLKVRFDISFNNKTERLIVSRFVILTSDDVVIVDVNHNTNSINSSFVDISIKDQAIIKKYCDLDKTLFNWLNEEEKTLFDEKESDSSNLSSACSRIILNIIVSTLNLLREDLSESKVYYVGPLRAYPKRYYVLDRAKTTISLDTLDGDAVAEILKESPQITKDVNKWLRKYGIQINVKEFKEVIHQLKVNDRYTKLDLDITDVGFGISQILPIIIQGFLSKNHSMTIIEQPEIHLHPKMQADLADLFIDIIKDNEKKIIIETHSEYILRRIRRRISEGSLPASMVSICLFHPRKGKKAARVELLPIEEKGYFKWPDNFYDKDLSDDTFLFIKNQL